MDIVSYLLGKKGGSTPTQTKSMTLGSSAPSTVTPDSGYALESVAPSIDTSVIKAENIAVGATILGVVGSHQGGSNVIVGTAQNQSQTATNNFTASVNIGDCTNFVLVVGQGIGTAATHTYFAIFCVNNVFYGAYMGGNGMSYTEEIAFSGKSGNLLAFTFPTGCAAYYSPYWTIYAW